MTPLDALKISDALSKVEKSSEGRIAKLLPYTTIKFRMGIYELLRRDPDVQKMRTLHRQGQERALGQPPVEGQLPLPM